MRKRHVKYFIMVVASLVFLPSTIARAQGEDPVHGELRAVRDAMIEAVNKNDAAALLSHLHENVVVTWLNGEVSRGPAEVKAYYDRMMTGEDAIVKTITINPAVERLADIYGNTAVAYGTSDDHYTLSAGMEFAVHSRWSATLYKENDTWTIVNFHASTNMFDNPLLNAARTGAYWAGGGGLIAGIALGGFLVYLKRPKRNAA